jgi:hypothetical protein
MRSSARAALLAAAMNLIPAAPLDFLRFLRVPAIVWVMRRRNARVCRERHAKTLSRAPARDLRVPARDLRVPARGRWHVRPD